MLVRLTSFDIKNITDKLRGFRRYRSPWGTFRAVELVEPLSITVSNGRIVGEKGVFLCIDDSTFDCWTESVLGFSSRYVLLDTN